MPVVIPALGQRRRKAKTQKFLPHEACILGDSGSLQTSKTFFFSQSSLHFYMLEFFYNKALKNILLKKQNFTLPYFPSSSISFVCLPKQFHQFFFFICFEALLLVAYLLRIYYLHGELNLLSLGVTITNDAFCLKICFISY